jgi:hypothetical protein
MRDLASVLILFAAVGAAGCRSAPVLSENPVTVTRPNFEDVWISTVRVLEKYFEIAYENRYDGSIETLPLASATLLEPWRHDAVGFDERLEATLQTIRRRCFVLVQPAPAGGFNITVEVYKELEHVNTPVFSRHQGGNLIIGVEPIREAVVASAIKPSLGWISLGRDQKLESTILDEIRALVDGPFESGPAPLPAQ